PAIVLLQAHVVLVVAEVDVDLIVSGERHLRQEAVWQLMLEAEGGLVGPRDLEMRRIVADGVSYAGRQTQTRSGEWGRTIRERVDQRIRPGETCGRSEAVQ